MLNGAWFIQSNGDGFEVIKMGEFLSTKQGGHSSMELKLVPLGY